MSPVHQTVTLRYNNRFSASEIRICGPQYLEETGLPGGIQRSIQILILTFDLDVGLVDPIAFIDRLQIRTGAFVELGVHTPAANAKYH